MADSQDEDSLVDIFWAVAGRLRSSSRRTLAPFDVAPSHFRALGVLTRHGAMRLGDLSEHLRIAPRSTTEVVDALEERGLVSRSPDPSDRRATLVSSTEAAMELMSRLKRARAREAGQLFDALSEQERIDLARLLSKLTD